MLFFGWNVFSFGIGVKRHIQLILKQRDYTLIDFLKWTNLQKLIACRTKIQISHVKNQNSFFFFLRLIKNNGNPVLRVILIDKTVALQLMVLKFEV